jgi:hypothetical protein
MTIIWGLGALLVVAGCSAPAPKPGGGDGPVLLADRPPGLISMVEAHDPPDFVLYGDRRAIVREGRDSGVLRLVEYHLTPERVQALFGAADHAGLFDEHDYSSDEQVPDGGVLVIMLRSAEGERLVRVEFPSGESWDARGVAVRFADSLQPSRWPAEDFTREHVPYRPGRVAVTFAKSEPGKGEVASAWPLVEVEPVAPGCVVLTGPVAEQAQALGETTARVTLWQRDGATFRAWIRPLLPDESDCAATERRYLR